MPFRPRTKLKLYSAEAIVKLDLPTPKRHWGDYILSRQLGMLVGPRGVGKTYFDIGLAISMATGAEFLGAAPKRPRKVVLLDGEMDLYSLRQRVERVSKSLRVEPPKSLLIINPDLFDGTLPSLSSPEGQRIIDKVLPSDFDVLLIDNYSCWSRGGREDADGWAPWIDWLGAHKRRGKTVILVHHTGKSGDQRGTSKREDSLDFVLALRPEPSSGESELSFSGTWTKLRHTAKGQAKPFRAALVTPPEKRPYWTRTALETADDRLKRVLDLQAVGMNMTQIAGKLGVDKSTVSRILRDRR
jgi:putative DNA primase/helicase